MWIEVNWHLINLDQVIHIRKIDVKFGKEYRIEFESHSYHESELEYDSKEDRDRDYDRIKELIAFDSKKPYYLTFHNIHRQVEE